MIWNTLKADSEVMGYSEFGRVDLVGKHFYDKYVQEFRHLRQLKDRVISNEKCIDYFERYVKGKIKHQIDEDNLRIIPSEIFYVSGDHSIYNDIYSMSFWKAKEIVAVEIQNIELVKLHKTIFEILWNIGKSVQDLLQNKKE